MSTYLWFCLALLVLAGAGLWLFRPRKCKECGGTGRRLCHDGAESDFHYAECPKCKGTGWKV